MDIDRKRIAAVRALEALGYAYICGEWLAPAGAAATPLSLMAKADATHGALMRRADAFASCAEGSDEEAELKTIVDAIEAHKFKRRPLGSTAAFSAGVLRPRGASAKGQTSTVHAVVCAKQI